jgi:hypothetical protein
MEEARCALPVRSRPRRERRRWRRRSDIVVVGGGGGGRRLPNTTTTTAETAAGGTTRTAALEAKGGGHRGGGGRRRRRRRGPPRSHGRSHPAVLVPVVNIRRDLVQRQLRRDDELPPMRGVAVGPGRLVPRGGVWGRGRAGASPPARRAQARVRDADGPPLRKRMIRACCRHRIRRRIRQQRRR